LFKELLELVDLDLHAAGDTQGCPQFHVMPRFVRDLPDNGKEVRILQLVGKSVVHFFSFYLDTIDESSFDVPAEGKQALGR
jgi:hypothetical protein